MRADKEIAELLTRIGLAQHVSTFENASMDMKSLMHSNDSDLSSIGIPRPAINAIFGALVDQSLAEQELAAEEEAILKGVKPAVKFIRAMKLELTNETNSKVKVATITRVSENQLTLHIDGAPEGDVVILPSTSVELHPAGYAEESGLSIEPPLGKGSFEWASYLKENNAMAAPYYLFHSNHANGDSDADSDD